MNKPSTIEEMKRELLMLKLAREAERTAMPAAETPIPAADRSQALPLSWSQQRLWFLDRMDPAASAAYHIPARLILRGGLDVDALRAALTRIVARHEVLRTRFDEQDGQPVQQIEAAAEFALAVRDLSAMPGHEQASAVERHSLDEASAPFDLAQGPLIRGQLLRLAEQEHVLLLTQHHIVSDGWSIGVLINEVRTLYTAFSQGLADPLPPLALQYADYAQWQRGWLQGERLERQLAFWRGHLGGAPALLELPLDRPRPPQQSYAGATLPLRLPAALADGLRQLARQEGVTLFMTLLAGWSVLLSRLSGQGEVVTGTPVANRQRGNVEGLIGFFVNTLALRVTVEDDPTVAQLLAQVKASTLDAYSHQDVAFEQVVEVLKPPRSTSHSPIFQVMLSLNNTPSRTLTMPGLTLENMAQARHNAQFELSLALEEHDGVLTGSMAYSTDLFDASTVARFGQYLETILAGMVADAQQTVSSLGILPAAERHLLLQQFQGESRDYPSRLVHELFEEQVARDGAATALVCGAERLSYAQLNERANRLAHYLRALGIGPDERVAICVERSVEMVVGLLAILKAGGAYVPLEPDYPAERLAYMLDDCAPRALLTHSALRARLDSGDLPVLELDRLDAVLAPQPKTNLERDALRPHHLAYVIYTSGSTGKPKGAMNQHDGVANRLLWAQETYRLTAQDRVLQKTPMAFDVSVWEFFLPLLAGAQLVMARPQGHQDPSYLAEVIESEGITTMHFVPSMLQLFLSQADARRCASLRRVLCSGEALPVALQQHFHRSLPEVELHNLYGPTEAAVDVTAWHCLPQHEGMSVPIGRPIANTAMYVLDRQGQPVPLGVAGELYIGGVQVARGYLNRPELTAERFVPDSFSAKPGAHMYKTGDVGRWLENGAIEYLGRNDFQVKLRGQRVELGEIEARLAACAGVAEAAVMARGEGGDMRLVAYVVPQAGAQLDAAVLRAALAQQMAGYMIPSAFVTLDAFPLTPNGKLDRKALPAPDAAALVVRAYEAPQGAAEEAIAAIWQELLGVEKVGRHDHFFELGGHSLMVIGMLDRLRQQGWHGEVRGVFTTPTLAALAATLHSEAQSRHEVPPNGIPAGATAITPEMLPLVTLTQPEIERVVASVPGGAANVQDIYPLAPLQEGILFHHLLGGEGDTYLMRTVLGFDTPARMDAFLAALQQVIDRHDILRSAVQWQGLPRPVQVVFRSAPLAVTELAAGSEVSAREQLLEITDPRQLRLDLQRAPLLSAWIVREPDSEVCHLALLTHHMVSDHVTLERIIGEIRMLLSDQAAELPPTLPYRNFVAETLTVDPAVHEAYFRDQLGDVDEPTAPFGLLDVRGDDQHVDEMHLAIDDSVSSLIRDLARQHGVSPAVLFHVAWAMVVAQCSDRQEAIFGTVLSGRLQGSGGADRALGMFINTLPVRIRLEGISVGDAVAAVYGQLSALLEHEQAPLSMAQRCSGIAALTPLFTSLLNYRHSRGSVQDSQTALAWQGIEATLGEEWTNYPLTLSVDDLGQAFCITAQCRGVSAARVAALLAHAVEQFARALRDEPAVRLSSLGILPAAERHLLLQQFQGESRDYPSRLVHELFEEQVARDGAATALVCGAERLSYAQLNERANRLAHYLRALGIGPDERVAICVERSVEMVVGLLAILKAGGAYVPLEPDYPAERLAYMLDDCAPRALLTHSALRARLDSGDLPVLEFDRLDAVLAPQPKTNLERDALRPDHLAYVIYTSGSTGKPKGAMNQHDGVANRLLWAQETYRLTAQDRVLQKTPMAFDVSVWEFFLPLLAGARLVMARPQGHQDPSYLAEVIESEGITTMHFVPSMLQLFLSQADARRCASLRRVLCSGEALPVALQQHFHRSLPEVELHNLYGPTEAAVDVTAWHCLPQHEGMSVPIGRPIANTAMYVLDRQGQPVPLGVAGELYIGGVQVARGYLNRPELTAERFVPDSFSAKPGAHMYKTGDVGRWLENGAIEYLGRNDFQVKLRGQRIELGEIEARLAACEGVAEVAVMARGEGGDMRLVAYVVPQAGAQLEAAVLRAALAQQMAEYMIPSAFVTLDAFPLTPNGKLDRKALPAPDAAALVVREYEAPQGAAEEAIATIWQELLGVERLGRHDHFFELGGHSLMVIGMLDRLRQQGWHGEVRGVFTTPTLAALAATLHSEAQSRHEVPPNGIPAGATAITPEMLPLVTLTQPEIERVVASVPGGAANVQDIYPLAPQQEGILFHHLLDGEGDTYLLRSVLGFDTAARMDAFLAALQRVIDRHDILRSAVQWQGLPRPVQVVFRSAPLVVTALTSDGNVPVREQLLAQSDPRHLRLDLQRAPLLSAWTVREPDSEVCHMALLIHHVVCDFTTLRILIRETGMVLDGRETELPEALPYRNFVANALAIDPAVHEAYFRDQLGDVDEPTAPFGLLDVQGDGKHVDEVRIDLDHRVSLLIRNLASQHGVSPAVLFHVAWAMVVAQCSGRQEAIFGAVLSGRQGVSGADRVLGMFINTLPLRVRLDGVSVAEAVAAVYNQLSELLEHEQAPLAMAQRCSGVAASVPLFTSLFNYRHRQGNGLNNDLDPLPDLVWQGIEVAQGEERTNYPLTLAVDDLGQGYAIKAQCVGVSAAQVAALLAHAVEQFAQALRDDPAAHVSGLSILPAAERHLLEQFQGQPRHYPSRLIHELFEEQAARDGAATALVCGAERLSYAQLNERANRVAHYLRGMGVGPEDLVGLYMERSCALIVGMLGILKAGAAYLPLDPINPRDRIAFMLEDAQPKLVLTQASLSDAIGELPHLALDTDWEAVAAHCAADPQVLVAPSNLAYVIYTSGSTGKPKGVQIEHGNVQRLFAASQDWFDFGPADTWTMFHSFAFDFSVWEIWGALVYGGKLVVVQREEAQSPDLFHALLVRERVTVLNQTPSAFQQLIAADAAAGTALALRKVIFGGEALNPAALGPWFAAHGDTMPQLINMYGITETTVHVTYEPLQAACVEQGASIGRPIPDLSVHVLDTHMNPAPIGVAGEMYVGGAGVARGYLNRPELTAERFIEQQLPDGQSRRLYKSGDGARFLPDGRLEYLGRLDAQVKIRGYRIELGEIEARLLACEGVAEAVVVARGDDSDKRLVAYLVPKAGAQLEAAVLRAELARQMAEYMVPSAFVTLDAFPLTPNGKLDRKVLPAPDGAALAARAYMAPQGDAEEAIAAIWQELLGVERVGRHDHFFELGGHSLLAMQYLARLRQELGIDLTVRALFTEPTLAEQAGLAQAAQPAAMDVIPAADRSRALPLSWSQQRLWFLDRMDPAASAAYHMPARLRLSGQLDVDALRAALTRIVARHEVLRTRFVEQDGQPLQQIDPLGEFALAVCDLSAMSGHEQASAVERHSLDQASGPFDMANGPLIRGQLLLLAEQEHVLLLTQHHIISDGWSVGLMVEEVRALYTSFSQGLPDPLPPLPVQYADYAQWQRGWLQGATLAAQLDFWKNYLGGAPALLELPTDFPRPAVQSYAGDTVFISLPAELSQRLHGLGQRHGVTLFMTLLAGWSALLSGLSGQDDIVIGTPVANRQRREIESLIGFFVNTLALRVRLERNTSVADLLAQVKASTLDAYSHQDLPFEQVVEALKPPRSMAHSPIFQVMLTMNNTPDRGSLELPGLNLSPMSAPHATTQFDLSLSLAEHGGTIQASFEYATDLYSRATIERLAGQFVTLLDGMVADEQQQVDRLPLLRREQIAEIVQDFNRTQVNFAQGLGLHELFEAQVQEDCAALALVSDDERLSYAELNRRANQVAHYLRGRGVIPDDRVGLCMERSVDLVVALLGVLKAGAAYVPLDPAYPLDRLAYMIGDSAPVVLVTQQSMTAGLAGTGAPMLVMDAATDRALLAGEADHDPKWNHGFSHAGNMAYVLYTSGSTGLPKGVMVEHRNVVNLVQHHARLCGLTKADSVLQFASFGFDNSIAEVFPALSVGARVVLRPAHLMVPDQAFVEFIDKHGVTMADLPTSFWHQWAGEIAQNRSRPGAPLRLVVAGGEKAEARHLANWFASGTGVDCRWINTYGPTEATVNATTMSYERDSTLPEFDIPIGRPVANSQVYILNRHLQPMPLGVAGEIYIGGAGVARGYLNKPELSAERFVADPFSGVPGSRMYKTGDLGRWLPDGTIAYIGRNDFQVKLRGFRIELGEVEARLLACEGVKEALVIAREDTPGDKRLVAYLLAHDGAQLDAGVLRTELSTALAEYMVPSAFVTLAAYPLNPNGKLDRKALPAPDLGAVAARQYEAPQGDVESVTAEIWQALLGLERVGRHDHFFELGGHSLMVISMLDRLRQQGWHGDVRGVFTAPTLAALAATLSRQAQPVRLVPPNGIRDGATAITPEMLPLVALTQPQIEQVAAAVPGGAANIQDIYPLAPLQEGILFHHLLGGEGDTYLLRSVLSFDTAARMDAFLAALQQVIDRHDILRSAIQWQGLPRPVQVVFRSASLSVTVLATEGDVPAREQLLAQTDPRHLRLDLQCAPLLWAWTVREPHSEVCHLALLNHHIVSDHVTLELIIDEIGMLLGGQQAELPPTLPYRNFVAETLTVDPAVHEAYFRSQLGDVDEPTAPFGLLDVRGDGQHVEEVHLAIDDSVSSLVRDLSRQHGVSPAVLFHVAWAMVVAQCSGRQEAIFGTVLSGRLQGMSGADRALGMFINTLPLRIRLEGISVGDAVAAAYAQLSDLLEHEQAPLAMAQRCSGVAASVPLFTSLFNYRHSRGSDHGSQAAQAWQGIEAAPGEEWTNYPLTLSVDDLGQAFCITAQCRGVSAARVAALLAHAVEQFARALRDEPAVRLSSLGNLPAAERHLLLQQFQGESRDYPSRLVHELFEEQVARDGAATALVCGAERLSYAQLNERANRLAHYLRALGIGPDERVAICVERSVEMVVGLLAILKAGGAYVPLEPDYPAERLAYMLDDCAPRALLTHSALRARLDSGDLPVLELDRLDAVLAPQPKTNLERDALRPHHLAYVIYTSGSTGKPKGAMNQHDGVANRLLWAQETYRLTAQDRVLQKTPMAFDVSVWEFFLPLLAGAQLVMARPQGHQDPSYLAEVIESEGITTMHFVPSMLQLFLSQADARRCTSLRRVLCSGEALPVALQQHFHRSLPEVELHNLYGPTEAAVDVTAWHCLPQHEGMSVPIGRPIANTAMYVLDRQGQPVPLGVAGELYIGGVQVARGYLNRPELTAERFVPDSFSAKPGAHMYKTGDVGRWLENGAIEYLGRNDFQVKLRGQRVELGEIEARLAACAGVAEAAVMARGEGGDMRLVAYVVPQAGAQLDAAVLRAALAQQMAGYMIPSAFVTLDAFPLTPNGKLDRKALPAPDAAALVVREYEAPQGAAEEAIAAIWQELLGVEKVGRHDHFFELGGHSLLAVQLLARIRAQFSIEPELKILFQAPALSAFAQEITALQLAALSEEEFGELMRDLESLDESELEAILATEKDGFGNE